MVTKSHLLFPLLPTDRGRDNRLALIWSPSKIFISYLVKLFKPQTPKKYLKCAGARILLVSNAMPLGIFAFYWMDGYKSMLWVAAIAAIAWYFSKPTLRKAELEMTPQDPNQESY